MTTATDPTPPAPADPDAPDPAPTPAAATATVERMSAIIARADTEQRALTAEEVTEYEALERTLQVERTDGEVRARHAAHTRPRLDTAVHVSNTRPAEQEQLDRAFSSWLRTGQENADITELRAQSEGTGSEGGYTVPPEMLNRMTERMKAFGGIEAASDSITTDHGRSITWGQLDDVDNTGHRANEGESSGQGADLVFDKTELGAYPYDSLGKGGEPLKISIELLQDSGISMETRVVNQLGQRLARAYAPDFVLGNGVNKPQGIAHGAQPPGTAPGLNVLRSVEVQDPSKLVYDDFIYFEHAIDPAYRALGGMAWAFNDTSFRDVKLIKNASGDNIWVANTDTNDPMGNSVYKGSIIGYGVVVDQAFPNIVGNDNTVVWGVFGNLREGFTTRRVRRIDVIRDPYTSKKTRQVEFVAYGRVDSIKNNQDAYVALVGKSA